MLNLNRKNRNNRKNRWMLRTGSLLVGVMMVGVVSWLALRPVQASGVWMPVRQGDVPPTPIITSFSPTQVISGVTPTLTVLGANFLDTTKVHLDGAELATTFGDAGTLTAVLPNTLTAGNYVVSVVDPTAGSATISELLVVVEPTPTPVPTDTPVPTATNTPVPQVSVTGSEPSSILSGQEGILSVFGTNFTPQSIVRLVGIGLLQTTFVNGQALTAVLPATLPPGKYAVEVVDPAAGVARSPNKLSVIAPTPTQPPTSEPLPPTDVPPTPEPPTPIPGQPSLVVRNFSTDPAIIAPEDTVTLRFEVFNQGNRSALGIAVSVDAGSKFVPANGQSSVVVPDLGAGSLYTVSLAVVAAIDTPPGPTSIPLTLTYRDGQNNTYTGKASLSIMVSEPAETASQVILSKMMLDPATAEPGKPIHVTLFVTNSGNEVAAQVLVRVAGTDNILLAGPQGDSIPLGDIPPGTSAVGTLPMIVSSEAKPGPQAQPVSIIYLQEGESQQITGSITVDVAKVTVAAPMLLLASYDTGEDVLQPGDRFSLTLTLRNVGDGAARNMLVTFGTVESSDSSGGDGTGGESGGSSTTPSTTFAPVGAGGTIYIDTVDANGGEVEVKQDFVVNGTVTSGIYTLPVTLRYQKPDESAAQDTLQVTVVVVAPPHLQVRLPSPLPETVNVGEPFPISLEIQNTGSKQVDLTNAVSEAQNGEIVEGAEVFVGPIASTEDASLTVTVMPLEEGPIDVTITLHYINDLNQEAAIVKTFSVQALMPPPPEDIPPDMGVITPEPDGQTSEEDGLVGRFLRGFLGLGS